MADMRYMGKMKNKYRGISICLIVCLIFLSGCSRKSKPVVYESTTEISYSWWGNDDRHRYTLQALDIFTEQNQGQIEVQANYGSWGGYENKMHIYMRSHNAPDVMQINYAWLSEYADEETGFYNLYDLKDIIHLENYTPEELAYGEMDGKLYAVPISFNTPMFYYNNTIYASYGLEIPKTWDDLFAAAKVMSRDGIYPLGTTKKQLFLMLVAYLEQITGKESVKADGSLQLTKADIAFMLDFYKRLIDEDVLMPIDSFNRNAFSTGKAAGALAWISDAANYCTPLEKNGSEVVVGDYLQDAAAKKFGWCVKPATMYAISATTEYPEEAAKLLEFLLNSRDMAQLQGTEKGIPISDAAKAALQETQKLSGYEKQADDMRENYADRLEILQPALENESVYDGFKVNADYYIYDKLSKDEVVEKLYEAIY